MAQKGTVLVTGSAGTVGGYIVDELLSGGYRVVAADRPGVRMPAGPADRLTTRFGDLTDLAFAIDAVAGCDSVIHAAASIDLKQPYEVLAPINVDAVRYLYEASRARGARRFVHFSSGSIYQATRGAVDETVPFDPCSAYELTKVESERYLWARPAGGPGVTVLRPTMIYGPRGRFLGAKLATIPPVQALIFNKIPRIRGGARCNWIHAEDVARAAVFLLEHPKAAGQAFNVADPTPMEGGDVLATITECYGLPLGTEVPFPSRLMRLVGPILAERDLFLRALSIVAARAWRHICEQHGLEPQIDPAIDREAFLYASDDVIFDTSKLQSLGFECRYKSLREGYPAVLRWYQEHRWVPSYSPDQAREWGGSVGFRFDETMAGTWRRTNGATTEPGRPMQFSVSARARNARQFARDGLLELEGTLDADDLARKAPLSGTLDISWRRKRELAYDFTFSGDDGRPYRFSGKKDVRLLRFLETMTTLPGKVLDPSGAVIGEAMLRFDLRKDLLSLVRSFDAELWSSRTNGATTAAATTPAASPTQVVAK